MEDTRRYFIYKVATKDESKCYIRYSKQKYLRKILSNQVVSPYKGSIFSALYEVLIEPYYFTHLDEGYIYVTKEEVINRTNKYIAQHPNCLSQPYEYYPQNKTGTQLNKAWIKRNPEKLKQNRQREKETRKQKAGKKCECGIIIKNMRNHLKTKVHLNIMETRERLRNMKK